MPSPFHPAPWPGSPGHDGRGGDVAAMQPPRRVGEISVPQSRDWFVLPRSAARSTRRPSNPSAARSPPAVWIVPVASVYVAVEARLKVMRGSSVPGDMKFRSSDTLRAAASSSVIRTPPRHASTHAALTPVTHCPYADTDTGSAAPANSRERRPITLPLSRHERLRRARADDRIRLPRCRNHAQELLTGRDQDRRWPRGRRRRLRDPQTGR